MGIHATKVNLYDETLTTRFPGKINISEDGNEVSIELISPYLECGYAVKIAYATTESEVSDGNNI